MGLMDVGEQTRFGTNTGKPPRGLLGGLGDMVFGKDQRAGRIEDALAKYDPETRENLDLLGARMRGENSLVEMQVNQAMQQGISAQQGMAATARPGGQVAANRQASQMGGRLTSETAGLGAAARLAEMQQAQDAYANLLMGLRGQELQAAGAINMNPTNRERMTGAISSGLQLAML